MDYTVKEVLQFVNENDVKFVRLAFCDIFGTMKNISILSSELKDAFENGVSFDAVAIKGFGSVEKSDMFLFPDPSTIEILPWRPQQGRVVRLFCDIKKPDGTFFENDSRRILKDAVNKLSKKNLVCKIGTECEFYLFKTDDEGSPSPIPYDNGGYFDVAPLDKGENIRREICYCLEDMDIYPVASHHEQGPGQNEIDFKFNNADISADNLFTFKSVVKAIASKNGLYASFMPKPLKDESGNGLHINLSLFKNELNIFKNDRITHSKEAESFIAGVLNRINDITLFLNPVINSYDRFGSFEAPRYVSWSHQNRSQLIRIPASKGSKARMELRSPDPSCNIYIALALIIYAGNEGIEKEMELPMPLDIDTYNENNILSDLKKLPSSISEAVEIAENSDFIKKVLPSSFICEFIKEKKKEINLYNSCNDKDSFIKKHCFDVL